MLQGFKEFIMRGSVIELAVAVIIGAAFTAIVTAVVESIINPLLGAFVPTGDLSAWVIEIPGIFATAQLGIGAIISAIINFIAVAFVVYFALVLPMNKLAARRAAKNPVEEEPAGATSEELLTEIRDLLAKQQQS